MKRSLRSLTAFLLCVVLLLSCLAGCAKAPKEEPQEPEKEETSEPEKSQSATPIVTAPVTTPAVVVVEKEPVVLPDPIVPEPSTKFPEAFDLLVYLSVLTEEDAAAYDQPMTGEQASRALTALGTSPMVAADAATVTGAELLNAVMNLLGYVTADETEMLAKAEKLHLTRGFFNFDPAAELTVEQGANILLSALQTYTVDDSGTSTGIKLAANMGVTHIVLTEYDEPFNRPGSTWIDAATGTPVTGEYTAIPLVVFGTTTCWCDILVALGFEKDDPANDMHIPKYFRNSTDGSQLTEKFWKHHNGEEGHGECMNDYTGGQDATLEIYEIDDYEFRNVIMNTFLGVSKDDGLTIYGFERNEWGPYTEETRPAHGVYITHCYWNAYGLGNGYEVVEPATVLVGTLNEGNVMTTTIDGVQYENSQTYGFGKKLTTAPVNVGKQFYFLLDRYGFVLGCSETPVE